MWSVVGDNALSKYMYMGFLISPIYVVGVDMCCCCIWSGSHVNPMYLGLFINYVDKLGVGVGYVAKCKQYYLSTMGVKNPQNLVNIVYELPLKKTKQI